MLNEIRTKTANSAVQPSNHSKKTVITKDLPENITHVYTRQHQTTGLDAPYEGPFPVASRVSRSVIKIIVGKFKSGEDRYEYRHLNDVKIAHPDSPAAVVQRPKLGRPAHHDGQTSTDVSAQSPPSLPKPVLDPPSFSPAVESKQSTAADAGVASSEDFNHETSIPMQPAPASVRPARSTRNPNPRYVDAIQRPWSASTDEVRTLNQLINAGGCIFQ